jgi:rifampicin phosphotransferase
MTTACSQVLVPWDVPWTAVSPREVGGKGWNLLRLRALGFTVPRFAILPASVVSSFLQSSQSSGFEADLHQALAAVLGSSLLAVRSSAADEDSAAGSFAGLLDSELNVRRDDVPAAIRRVGASAFSERALLYRRRKRLRLDGISTAVILQEMIPAVVSGVLFTRDPGDGAPVCVVVAGAGLGDGVVTDAVDTDTYRISWDSDRFETEAPAPHVLTPGQIRELRDVGVRAEGAFGAPQDLEWAFDGEGRLSVLQARPIVPPAQVALPAGRRFWDNSNIIESYPGATLPLTFSFVRTAYEKAFRRAALGFLPVPGAPRPRSEVFQNLLGLLEGRVYYNLVNWYEMFSYLPAPEHHRRAWDRMMGVAHPAPVALGPGARVSRLVSLLAALGVLLRANAHARQFFERFDRLYGRFRDAADAAAGPEAIVAAYRSLEQEAAGFWHLTVYNDFVAIRCHEWLTALCHRWGLDTHPGLQNALLSGEPGIESVAPVRSLAQLAETVRQEAAYRELFQSQDARGTWTAIQADERYRGLRDAFAAHLAAYGDRGLEELKLETPTLREEPHRLVDLVRSFVAREGPETAVEEGEGRARRQAEETVRRHPLSVPQRILLSWVLSRARRAIRTRENMRFARSRLFGIVRRLFRRLGENLAEIGLLETAADIAYLTVDEALGVVEGTAVTRDLAALVRLRKTEYLRYAARDPGERVETVGIPCTAAVEEPARGTGERIPPAGSRGQVLRGTGCSAGRAQGMAKVILDPREARAGRDHILIARSTDPGWVFLMVSTAGIVVEKGSLLSHTAIIARELGIATVVGVKDATRLIPDGASVTIDGTTGEVRWL